MRLLAYLVATGIIVSQVESVTPRGSRSRRNDAVERRTMSQKGMSMSGSGACSSKVADDISEIPAVITLNPERCCQYDGPTAVYVTHAQPDPSTETGFDVFWNAMYLQIAETSEMEGTCFVMTGYNPDLLETTLSELLMQVNTLVARLPDVPAMMSTDPTEQLDLVNLFRLISNTPDAPSIGVFNAGLTNLNTEAIISGQARIPFVGYTDDAQYGTKAADITKKLLKGTNATAICFNGQPELLYVGRRCAAYYQGVTDNPPERLFGVACRSDSSVEAILSLLLENSVNAVYSQVDCCQVVAEAVERARNTTNSTIVLGCQDENTAGRRVNFVTKQPIELQAYQTSSWVNLPAMESMENQNGEAPELFPSLLSLLNTEIYSVVFF